jgi:hypothetical protein
MNSSLPVQSILELFNQNHTEDLSSTVTMISTQEGVGLREPNQEYAMSGSDSIFTEADTIDELKANFMDETLRYAPAS